MGKIDCCLRYEVAPLSHMIDLRIISLTLKLHSTHYESDDRCDMSWIEHRHF